MVTGTQRTSYRYFVSPSVSRHVRFHNVTLSEKRIVSTVLAVSRRGEKEKHLSIGPRAHFPEGITSSLRPDVPTLEQTYAKDA